MPWHVHLTPFARSAVAAPAQPDAGGKDAPFLAQWWPARASPPAALAVPQPEADARLVERAAAGERRALVALYDRYAAPAYSLAVRLVGAAAAEDVVQDAFVTLLERPGLFDPARGSFRAWFMTTVHHRCLNLLRARRSQEGEERLAVVPDPAPEPADLVVQHLEDARVRAALRRLPEAQREALVLAYYGGLSQTVLAERLGVPLGTIKARMRRGLIALRGILQGEAPAASEEAGL